MNDRVSRVDSAVVSGQRPRAAFLARTYNHLLAAIVGFVGLEVVFFQTGVSRGMFGLMIQLPWLAIFGAFMVVSWLFSNMAASRGSQAKQYIGLAGYVVAFALLASGLIYMAWTQFSPDLVRSAAIYTLVSFAALTGIVYYTRKDFTFLKPFMMYGGFCAIGLIVLSALFGFQLGIFFMVGMLAYTGGAILYSTSDILQNYPDDAYVSGALSLFASVIMLFWYILQILMSIAGSD